MRKILFIALISLVLGSMLLIDKKSLGAHADLIQQQTPLSVFLTEVARTPELTIVSTSEPIIDYPDTSDLITYGFSTTDEITNQNYEQEYSFYGQVGDIIIVESSPLDGNLRPSLTIFDSQSNLLAKSYATFDEATLIYEIVVEGIYTIIATRYDGRTGDTSGKYNLYLEKIAIIDLDSSINLNVTSEEPIYLAILNTQPSILSYEKLSGSFNPSLSINIIEDQLFGINIDSVIDLSGEQLHFGTVLLPNNVTYIIKLGEALLDFNFRIVEAEINIKLSAK